MYWPGFFRYWTNRELIDYEELAHAVMKAEKTHPLPSESWRPGAASGIWALPVQRPENQECSSALSVMMWVLVWGQEKTCVSAISEGGRIFPTQSFCTIQVFNGLDVADPHWWSLLSLLTQMLTSSGNSRTDTLRNHIYQLSEHHLAQLRWYVKLITTSP